MKKTALILGVLLASPMVFGFGGLIQKKVKESTKASPAKSSRLQSDPNACVNFTGKWKGTCDKEESILTLKQDNCISLEMTSQTTSEPAPFFEVYDLTGAALKSQTASGMLVSSGMLSSASWSADKQTLQFEAVGLVASPFFGAPMVPMISARMTLDGSELVTFAKVQGLGQDEEEECRYQKIP